MINRRVFAKACAALASIPLLATGMTKDSHPSGPLVIEFYPSNHNYADNGEWHAGVIRAVVRSPYMKGRKIFEVAGQNIFPCYGMSGGVCSSAWIILLPGNYRPNGEDFGIYPRFRWVGGDEFVKAGGDNV